MNAQGSERLSSALGETDVGQRRLVCSLKNVVDGVGDIIEGEVVDREIPECGRVRMVMNRLLRVFVAPVVSKLSMSASKPINGRGRTGRGHAPRRHSPSPPAQTEDTVPCRADRPKPHCSSEALTPHISIFQT